VSVGVNVAVKTDVPAVPIVAVVPLREVTDIVPEE
jgi:hypothetical protein